MLFRSTSPVRSVWLNIPELVRAAKQTAATGASEFCIVAAVRGPDDKLMEQMREGVAAIRAAVDIQVAASLGMLTRDQVTDLVDMGVHRYNHNLEAGRSYFPEVVTTHSFEERWETCLMVKESGMELCCGGLVGMGVDAATGSTLEHFPNPVFVTLQPIGKVAPPPRARAAGGVPLPRLRRAQSRPHAARARCSAAAAPSRFSCFGCVSGEGGGLSSLGARAPANASFPTMRLAF